jgi:hypothetical protein
MTVMAGFLPNNDKDIYHVPRANVGLPEGLNPDDAAKILFPNLNLWRSQSDAIDGDESKSAKEFLTSVIVYLSEVIIHDGIMWKREHKTNPSVLELQRRMDGRTGTENYSTWAERKFTDINAEIRLIRSGKDTQDSNQENKLAQTVSAMQGLNKEIKEELELLVTVFSNRFLC